MNNIKAFILFFSSASFIFYFFTFFSVLMLNVLLEKKLSLKGNFGYSAIILGVFYILMFSGRGLNIKIFWNLSFYLAVLIMYVLFLTIIIKLISLGLHLSPKTNLIILISSISVIFSYGFYNAQKLTVKTVNLTSDKITKDYKFVQISDVHLGTESSEYFEKIIDRINSLSPDGVLITGDFIDDHKLKPEDLKCLAGLKAPAYFITGNHERYSNYTDDFFKECKAVKVLDHSRRFDAFNDEITVFGIEWNRDNIMNKKSEQAVYFDSLVVDASKFNIFLNHEPALVEEAEISGMDLMLSGHTHKGQIYPFYYFVRMRYKYMYGLYEIGKMNLYVTSGTGVWGPFLRIGSNNEIVEINIKPMN